MGVLNICHRPVACLHYVFHFPVFFIVISLSLLSPSIIFCTLAKYVCMQSVFIGQVEDDKRKSDFVFMEVLTLFLRSCGGALYEI